jgi:hypothetical protein
MEKIIQQHEGPATEADEGQSDGFDDLPTPPELRPALPRTDQCAPYTLPARYSTRTKAIEGPKT